LNEIKNPKEEGQKIVSSFRSFMDLCRKSVKSMEKIYEEMKETILSYEG